MPFKSQAQRDKFAQLLSEKRISQKEFDEWNQGTPAKLPVRIAPKKKK